MTKEEIREIVLRVLGEIAPEADLTRLKPDVSFREQLDIDSMDFLNFVIALDEELQVSVPESEYGKLYSIDSSVEVLASLRDLQTNRAGGNNHLMNMVPSY